MEEFVLAYRCSVVSQKGEVDKRENMLLANTNGGIYVLLSVAGKVSVCASVPELSSDHD